MKKKHKIYSFVEMYEQPALGKVDGTDPVMALTVDPTTIGSDNWCGLIRVITDRSKGGPENWGNVDMSILTHVSSSDGLTWQKGEKLEIEGLEDLVEKYGGSDRYFLGPEDPDIFVDEEGLYHVYFTVPYKFYDNPEKAVWHLGYASGASLHELKIIGLAMEQFGDYAGFKEVSITPRNSYGQRLALMEAGRWIDENTHVPEMGVASFQEFGDDWKFEKGILHMKEPYYDWCDGYASPMKFFSKDVYWRNNCLLGVINARQKRVAKNERRLNKFRAGLFLFNIEKGEIEWVSPEPFLEDPEAEAITFSSELIELDNEKALLYAHPNDAFIRVYEIDIPKMLEYVKSQID